ncbi:MAG: 2,5-diamino-6-(ribosylamino)-4(3H)-pyrimidinone 5'-phosphate reductase, partial [Candidatus Altiarchaeales archaeon]|nr:2,5-diamino-6-(ribosylamino)-4(3H)-pyrimidinone 5'-phosphate reductase [Candidatus Altiarchaeales archaeon]
KPFVFINAAMSVDGKISTVERKQVRISNDADLRRVDGLRAGVDAVLVGMTTVVGDDPKLTVKSEKLRKKRINEGKPENPMKVTVGKTDNMKIDSDFLDYGDAEVVIFTTEKSDPQKISELREKARIFVGGRERVDLRYVMRTLREMGVERVMVEGGATINYELIREGLVDEIYVAIAPIIFGGSSAPTLMDGNGFTGKDAVRLELIGNEKLGDLMIMKYRVID